MAKFTRVHERPAALGDSVKMATADSAVVLAGAAAATAHWWAPLVAAIPDVLQGVILVATVIFVVARATNEVVKFWRSQQDRKDSDDRT